MLPKHLATAGYKSHHVGKWHLGFHTPEYTPVGRGFDSSLGYLEGGEDHFTHWCGASKLDCGEKNPSSGATTGAFDLWNQSKARFPGAPVYGINGTAKDEATYSGFVFTQRAVDVIAGHPLGPPLFLFLSLHNAHAPLEAPQRFLDLYPADWVDRKRQLSAMVRGDSVSG
jgi:arylsulfatase A-like enzyme